MSPRVACATSSARGGEVVVGRPVMLARRGWPVVGRCERGIWRAAPERREQRNATPRARARARARAASPKRLDKRETQDSAMETSPPLATARPTEHWPVVQRHARGRARASTDSQRDRTCRVRGADGAPFRRSGGLVECQLGERHCCLAHTRSSQLPEGASSRAPRGSDARACNVAAPCERRPGPRAATVGAAHPDDHEGGHQHEAWPPESTGPVPHHRAPPRAAVRSRAVDQPSRT
jgi:hypothetical protein